MNENIFTIRKKNPFGYKCFLKGYTKVCNHPQPSTTIYSHPQPSTTTQKLHKKVKIFGVNSETDVDIDNDMKQWYIYTCVCVCVCVCLYTFYDIIFTIFPLHLMFFLSAFKIIHLMLRAMRDIALKTFIFFFFFNIKLPFNVKWL